MWDASFQLTGPALHIPTMFCLFPDCMLNYNVPSFMYSYNLDDYWDIYIGTYKNKNIKIRFFINFSFTISFTLINVIK